MKQRKHLNYHANIMMDVKYKVNLRNENLFP